VIALIKLPYDDGDIAELVQVLKTGKITQGVVVDSVEKALAFYLGVKHVVLVSSGTAALHIGLLALGVSRGDLVLTTSFSFVATANVIELVGATPIFVDIDPGSWNISHQHLEETLEKLNREGTLERVKAIIPVHLFGVPVDEEVFQIAERYRIPVLEDAAGALGTTLSGRKAGTLGLVGCFSFHPRKVVTSGEGGALVTDNDGIAEQARLLRSHGIDYSAGEMRLPGFNYRMTDFQAAMLAGQVRRLQRLVQDRLQVASRYVALLRERSLPLVPQKFVIREDTYPSLQNFAVLMMRTPACSKRKEIISLLRERGVETTIGTWHIPLTQYYSEKYGYKSGDFPQTDRIAPCTLSLPFYPGLTPEEQEAVADHLSEVLWKVS
jgi:dTDP-4-amino-4,6-dideoxygalactose transaminase